MAPAVRQIHDMGGGSREQKDIFRDLYLEVQRRLGHTDEVIELAQERLLANPRHVQSLAALVWAYGRTGQSLLRRQVCQQLVTRATDAGLAPPAPDLLEAQQPLQAAV